MNSKISFISILKETLSKTILVRRHEHCSNRVCVRTRPKTSKKFCGVFPSDKLPQTIDRYPCGLVVNIDPSTKPGTHWIGIFLTSPQNGEWFDSYGKPPEFYGAVFTEFMNNHCNEWEFQKYSCTFDILNEGEGFCVHACISSIKITLRWSAEWQIEVTLIIVINTEFKNINRNLRSFK